MLTHGRCSNHAARALDDVDEVALTLAYAALRPQLTEFGKALLLGEGTAAQPETVDGRVLYGTLGGKTRIAMVLHAESDDSLGGSYFYEKFGKGIALSGQRTRDRIELTERLADTDGAPTVDGAKLRLTVAGAHVTGRWIGAKQQFDVDLAP